MKRFTLVLCILMAVLIVVVSMTTISFSWFKPDSESGSVLQFKEDTTVRSTECSLVTYKGNYSNGVITYESSPCTDTVSNQNGTMYYKTIISNNHKKYDTNVSLYLPKLEVSENSVIGLGVAVPTNSYRTFTSEVDNIHIIRNAFISTYRYDKMGTGKLTVEWFVKCEEGSVSFDPTKLYLMYN